MGKILENKVFISTRPEGQSAELENLLTEEAATLISMPTIEVRPLPLGEFAWQQLKNIDSFNWIVFTSPNGLRYFFARLFELQNNYGLPEHLKIAVVGKISKKHFGRGQCSPFCDCIHFDRDRLLIREQRGIKFGPRNIGFHIPAGTFERFEKINVKHLGTPAW